MSTKQIEVLIVEDDLSFAIELEMLIEDIGCKVLKRVDNSAAALEVIFGNEPDLILMDIDIKGMLSGVEIAQKIKHLNIPVLFITSHHEMAMYKQATESNSIGYLVKPLQSFTLRSTINLAIEQLASSKAKESNSSDSEDIKSFLANNYFFFKKKDIYQKVNINDLLYLQSDNVYINIFTVEEKFVVRQKLSEMLNKLPKQFIAIHRSTIVNIRQVDRYNHQTHKLFVNGTPLEVSRSKREEILALLPKMK